MPDADRDAAAPPVAVEQQEQEQEDPATSRKVLALLEGALGSTGYSTLQHEPTPTSEDSARVRGATLASGAKAMLLS